MPLPHDSTFEEVEPRGNVRIPTRLEPADDFRPTPRLLSTPPPGRTRDPEDDTLSFRPVLRPPTPLLGIVFDGREDAEWIRICGTRFVIGRCEGDLVIPHDELMSGRHAEIVRQLDNDSYRWVLADLQSTNGTFVRVGSAQLRHGQEFLLGARRYRFSAAPAGNTRSAPERDESTEHHPTRGWQSMSSSEQLPSLVQVTEHGEGHRFLLTRQENWIGRDSNQCSISIPDDRMVSPRHARLHKDAKGRWHLENAKSKNGIWLAITKMPIEGNAQLQLGEQRFILRVPT